MLSFFFFKNFNSDVFHMRTKCFNFVFYFNSENSFFFSFCFKMSRLLLVFNQLSFFFLIYPSFNKRILNVIRNLIFSVFFFINFFFKSRLRFSGLGYFVEKFFNSLKIHVGLTRSPIFICPKSVFFFNTNRKKKKLLLKGYIQFLLNNFCSLIRSVKKCDLYKHKGIRWRFEILQFKEGKRSGNR